VSAAHRIDVQPPAVACDKVVCADVDTDGVCDDAFASTNSLRLPCAINFPFDLIYQITSTNTGDARLIGVQACDPDLIADALAAGLTVGPSDLGTDGCTAPFDLDVNASSVAFCTIHVPSREAWLAFSELDVNTNSGCYTNDAAVEGLADPELICTDNVDPRVTSSCEAEVCLEPKCHLEIVCPPDQPIDCTDPTDPDFTGKPTLIHDCDFINTVGFRDVTSNGDCPQEYVIKRTWFATAPCDVHDACIQRITVTDTTPPVIDECPTNAFISCDDVLLECDTSGLIAHDNCGPVHRTCRDVSTTGTCTVMVEREYIVTDDCGNESSCPPQFITIVDTNGPELTCPPDVNTLGCLDSTHPDDTGWPIVGADCNSVGVPTWVDEPMGTCPTVIKRTWAVRDECDNPSICMQLIPIDDIEPPVIECPSNGVIDCSTPFPPVSTNGVEASDNCALDTVQCFDLGTTGTCTEVSLRECVATDLCGNTAFCRYTITRIDTNGPEITCPADVTTIGCTDSTHPDDTGWPTVQDDCNSTGEPTWEDEPSGTCPTIITRTWTVLDVCGNPSSCIQEIPVDDNEPPDIVCPADFEWNCDEPLPDCTTDGVIAVDSCGLVRVECMGDVPGGVTEPTCTPGTLGFENITHNNATDAAIGESQFFVDLTGSGSTVTFTFRNEGPLPSVITEIYFDNGSLLGIATINDAPPGVDYVQDGSPPDLPGGNTLVPPFEVTEGFLAEPSAPPAMSGVGPGESVGIVFNILPGKTLQDVLDELADGTLRIGIRGQAFASSGSESFVNTRCNESCTETIVRKYRAIDDCGNVSTCGQIITLVDDVPPVIEECPTDAFISCTDEAPACDTSGVIAHDNCGPVHRSCHDVTIPGSCPQDYTIERTYTVTDNCGNVATCSQAILVRDQEAPDLECPDDIDCTCTTGWKVIDFETDGFVPLPAGFRVDGYLPGLGVFVQTNNAVPGHPDLAIIFDSANPTGNDPDLVTPGYHPTNTVAYGNVLIIAEYDTDTNPPDSLVDDPNDEAGRPAGWIDMTFDDAYTAAELVICDTDQGETTGTVQFFDGAVQLSVQPIAVLGDNSIQTITYSGAEFNRLRVNMPGSGSIPEIRLLPVCVPDCDTSAMPTATDNCDPEVDVYCIDVGTTGVGGGAGGSTYTWKWQPGDYPGSVALSNLAGTWDKVAASYTPTLQRLVWEVTFADQISDAITVVVNNGPNPTGIGGVYVMFYFDATDSADPRLTAYVYNGRPDRTSWRDGDPDTPGDQPGDLIASSLTDSGFIHELSVTDIAGKRIFRFDIDVGAINAHVPLWPNLSIPYHGAGFDGGIAMWLASFDQLTTSYSAGRLTQWEYYKSAYFDTGHLKTAFECEESRIERKCFATDDCGNVSTCGYSVIIDECVSCACTLDGDTTPPVINCPDDVVVACGDSTDPGDTGMATATDECDPFVTITFEDSDPAARDTVIIRTWYAEDECGNIASCEQAITVGDGSNAIVFHETFNGYTYFPDQHPLGDPINAGLPLKSEGAGESWYGGRFEVGDGGSINSDLAVQQAGGDGNNTPVGRVEDDAGMLFHIDTSVYTQVTLTFRWRMFDAGSSDRFVAGYYVGDVPFAGDTPDGENDDLVHRFTTDGPGWEQWTELVRANTGNWKWETLTLPAGQKDVWVAFWVDNGHGDFAKIDDVKVIVSCP